MDNQYQPQLPNSTMAIVSLIAGIGGVTILPGLASIVALITGFMAKKEIKESMGSLGGDGLATIGIVLGFVGIAIGLLVCCIVFFSFGLPFILLAAAGELFVAIPF